MEHATLVAAAPGQSLANGWDAICAINARQVNAIFFQQYLQGGPTSPARPLRAILAGDSPTNYWLLDVVAGPPQVSIDSDLGSGRARVTMFLLRGALIQFDSTSMAMTSAILVQPNESTLVAVRFEPKRDGTLVTVRHSGWSALPGDHPARHGLTGAAFSRMIGLWWGVLMTSLREHVAARQER